MWIVYFKTKLSTYCVTRVGVCVISGAHLTNSVSKGNVGGRHCGSARLERKHLSPLRCGLGHTLISGVCSDIFIPRNTGCCVCVAHLAPVDPSGNLF